MSEYRHDPLHNRWVILGDQRAARPQEFDERIMRRTGASCPFCAGNESQTPTSLLTLRAPGDGGWTVRVVPNKFPAVESMPQSNGCSAGSGLFTARPALGEHEVIIESPRHVASLSELTPEECSLTFVAYQQRLAACRDAGHLKYVQIFKNVGPAAGASIEHAHSQLLAMPHVPTHVADEIENCRAYQSQFGRPLLAEMLCQEERRGERLVLETDRFVAFCPWASRFPYEVWIVPRAARSDFAESTAEEAREASRLTRDLVGCIESTLGKVGYNYLLHSQPFDGGPYDHYHWHIELFPRITKVAGFEWSTGVFINTVAPETAAKTLRAAAATR